jgi:hypothetical protein
MSIRTQVNLFALFVTFLLGVSFFPSPVVQEAHPVTESVPADEHAYRDAVTAHYQAAPVEVANSDQALDSLELPVAYFIARYGLGDPQRVRELRQQGHSWQQVAAAHGLGPEVFYFPLPNPSGRALSAAYEKFHGLPRAHWPTLELTDEEIVGLVNLRFLAEHSGERAARVAELNAQGHDFLAIHAYLQKQSSRRAAAPAAGGPEEAS